MSSKIEYSLTPWDTKSLELKTAEIKIDSYSDLDNFKADYCAIEEKLLEANVQFVYTRITSFDRALRDFLQKSGFYFVETSLEFSLIRFHNFEKRKLPIMEYRLADVEDLSLIKTIARDSFNFGRFHEDVNISMTKSRLRYYNWIDDLVNQNAEIYVAKVGNDIVGFNIQKTDHLRKVVTLVLAGCKVGAEIFSMSLWNEIIYENKIKGFNQINALISASNIGVFNIYTQFNFTLKNTYLGFHKMIIKN